jgi:hypothetical protein
MQYVPLATPSPDDMHHGHSHGHDHGGEAPSEPEAELTIREQLTRDYTEETCNVDWSLTTERDENGFSRLHYAALDNQVTIIARGTVERRALTRCHRLRSWWAW